jgi:hypothetical protein
MTIDDLLAASVALSDQVDGLVDRLNAVTGHASSAGIEVTVNLDGRLIGVELTAGALKLGASDLGAELFRLSGLAATQAAESGAAVLRDSLTGIVDPELLPNGVQNGHNTERPIQRYQL